MSKKELFVAMQIIVYKTKLIVRKNIDKKIKNVKSYVFFRIYKVKITVINILSIVILEDILNPNWYINFMILPKKKILYFYLTQILLKIVLIFFLFRYLQNLLYINFNATNHICIS